MNHYDYQSSRDIGYLNPPFAALIMAAYRRADSLNAEALRAAFPDITAELQARYDAPGGFLPGETDDAT